MHQIMKEYEEYFDDIGPHEFGCKITMKVVAKNPDDLLRHINGKKFKKGLEKAALTRGSELPDANRTDEEEMEQDGMEMLANVINDSSSEDDDELNRDDEYPEFVRTCGESVVETESYDFAVMDTEEDMDSTKRKRKTDNSMACKKKRVG
ncbi:unnamed protein product [Litomosoides sigmodontis]|uniref:Uncharacterized protein n=1 Tax=Litomosoides sigmodontis TaxID=42156 RepID=A0A3P6U0N0_LITSI|nr:unnamed protein product [Litomosoides sigmodontis]